MEDKDKYSLFIGRWQPFHNGHKWLIDRVLNEGKKVCIGIMNTKPSSENPYTFEEREEMIKSVYGHRVKIISVPEIDSIHVGRDVGYEIVEGIPPDDIREISGTKIRLGIQTEIPLEVERYLSSRNQK